MTPPKILTIPVPDRTPQTAANRPAPPSAGAIAVTAVAAGVLAAGAYAYAGMWPTSQLFGRCVVAAKNSRQIALTFDDGPNDPDTHRLLEILAKHGVRATFFMIGRFVRQRPEIARAVAAAGHLIGNHTMTHPLLLIRPPQVVRQELRDCNAALEDALGAPVRWFRPPHGGRRPDVLRAARELAAAGGDYKVYKNTLVRLAVADGPKESIRDLLTGPTAIAFVQGDISAVAKALRDFAKANPNLVVKGGIAGDGLLSASEMTVLADLPPRQTLLAQFAGALSAPMQQLAGLLEALPRNLAYGISALLDQKRSEGGGEASAPTAEAPAEEASAPTAEAPAEEASAE